MRKNVYVLVALALTGLVFASPVGAQAPRAAPAAAAVAPYDGFFPVQTTVTAANRNESLPLTSLLRSMYQSALQHPPLQEVLQGNQDLRTFVYSSAGSFENSFRQAYGLARRETITRAEFAGLLRQQVGRNGAPETGIILPGFQNGREQARLRELQQQQQALRTQVAQARTTAATAAPSAPVSQALQQQQALTTLEGELESLDRRLHDAEGTLRTGFTNSQTRFASFSRELEAIREALKKLDDETLKNINTRLDEHQNRLDSYLGWIVVVILLLSISAMLVSYIAWRQRTSRAAEVATRTRVTELEEGVIAMQAQLSPLERGVAAMQAQLLPLERGVAAMQARLEPLEKEVSAVQVGLRPLRDSVSAITGQLAGVTERLSALEAVVGDLREGTAQIQCTDEDVLKTLPSVLANLAVGKSVGVDLRVFYQGDPSDYGAVVTFTRTDSGFSVNGMRRRLGDKVSVYSLNELADPWQVMVRAAKSGRLDITVKQCKAAA